MTMSDPHSDGGMSRALDIFGGVSNSVSGESASRDEFFDSDMTSKDCNSVSFSQSGTRAGV